MSETRIEIRCPKCGVQTVTIRPAMPEGQARDYCALLDGSSSLYVTDPRKDESSQIGKCVTCGGPFVATPARG